MTDDSQNSKFCWRCTPTTASQGVLSVLAIAETIVAVGIVIWVAFKFQSMTHIIFGVCVAPFLLLRTAESTKLAFVWFEDGKFLERMFFAIQSLHTKIFGPPGLRLPPDEWSDDYVYEDSEFDQNLLDIAEHQGSDSTGTVEEGNLSSGESGLRNESLDRPSNGKPAINDDPEVKSGWIKVSVRIVSYIGIAIGFVLAGLLGLVLTAVLVAAFSAFGIIYKILIDLVHHFVFMVVRIAATVTSVVRQPRKSIEAITENWRRICFATDTLHVPEVLPGSETETNLPDAVEGWRFSSCFPYIPRGENLNFKPIQRISSALIMFLPSWLYRMSLKGTSIVYLPFLFLIRSEYRDDLSAIEQIEDRESGGIEKLQWWYAVIVILVTFGALVVVTVPTLSLQWLKSQEGIVFAFLRTHYLPTDGFIVTIKGWHIARFVNAGIVIWLFYYAKRARIRLNHNTWSPRSVKSYFERFRIVQVVLSIYTILCGMLWLFKYAITFTEIPTIPAKFQIFP